MGFFKGFKRDFAQAVNELMPEYDGKADAPREEETGYAEETVPPQEQPEEEADLPDFTQAARQPEQDVNLDAAVTEAMLREENVPPDFYEEEEAEEEEFGVIPTYEMEGQFSMFEGEEETETETEALSQEPHPQEALLPAEEEEAPEEGPAEPEEEAAEEPVKQETEEEEREGDELSELGTEVLKEETGFDLGDTTYITKNTIISGDVETDGSLDVIGTINGNVTCLGKLILGGRINGSLSVGDLYANQAHINGEIEAAGSVKIGAGTICIGNIHAESAVIAGAVKGDLDVQGQVIVDSTAVILGNIKSRSVQVNSGAIVDGFCTQAYSDVNLEQYFAEEAQPEKKKEDMVVIEPLSEEDMKEKSGSQNRSKKNNSSKK